MSVKETSLKKKNITSAVNKEIGLPSLYADKLINDIFNILIENLKNDEILKIKNFGTFKILNKNKRVGRNPKNNKLYEISERNVATFKTSNYLKKKINNE